MLTLFVLVFSRQILANMPLVYGDIPVFDVEQSEINAFYLWSSEQFGTTVRLGFNNLRDLIIQLISTNDTSFYFIKHLLPILLLPANYYLIFTKFRIRSLKVKIVVSLLSLINPVFFGDFLTGQTVWIYLTLPWSLLYAIEIFHYKNFSTVNAVSLSVWLGLSFGMLPPIIIPWCILLAFFIFCTFIGHIFKKDLDKRTFLSFIGSSILSLGIFSLLIFPYFLMASSGQSAYTPASLIGDYKHNYQDALLMNTLRLAGNNGNGQKTLGYNNWSSTNLAGYFPLFIIFAGLLISTRKTKDHFPQFNLLLVMLFVLIFMHVLASNHELGTKLFQGQWMFSTIRNPSKLYVAVLPYFLFVLAVSLERILAALSDQKAKRVVVYIFSICALIYGWPFLRGDFGLFFNKDSKEYKKDNTVEHMANFTLRSSDRGMLISANHRDELNYQYLPTELNTIRFQGGLPETNQTVKNVVKSFNTKSNKFYKLLDILDVNHVFYKKQTNQTKLMNFSLFPLAIPNEEGYEFLKNHTNIVHENDNFAIFSTKDSPALVYSPNKIVVVPENTDFYSVLPLYERGNAFLSQEKMDFANYYNKYELLNNPQSNELITSGVAVVNNPESVLIEYFLEKQGDDNRLIINKINPLNNSAEKIYEEVAVGSPSAIRFDNTFLGLDAEKRRTYVPSGNIALTLGKLTEVDLTQLDPSFEERMPALSDATANRKGDPGIYSTFSTKASDGLKSILLGTSNHTAYVEKRLPVVKTKKYLLKFDYQPIKGLLPKYSIQEDKSDVLILGKSEEKKGDWNSVSQLFKPRNDSVSFFFYLPSMSDQVSESLVDNIHLYEVTNQTDKTLELTSYKEYYSFTNYSPLIESNQKETNLLHNFSFEDPSLWGEVGDASVNRPGKANLKTTQSSEAIDGSFSLHLESNNHTAYVSQRVAQFNPKNSYKLSFYYKNISGRAPSFAMWQSGPNEVLLSERLPDSNEEWGYYESTFTPRPEVSDLWLYLYSGSEGERTVNLFDNIKLTTEPQISSFIVEKQKNSLEPQNIVNSFNKVNPTKFIVDMNRGKNLLVLNESFHDKWNAYVVETKEGSKKVKYSLKSEHILVNNFANGWWVDSNQFADYLDENGNYKIEIEFEPQRKFLIALGVSGVLFAECILYLLWTRIHPVIKKHRSRSKENF